jgi:hypothetical protein
VTAKGAKKMPDPANRVSASIKSSASEALGENPPATTALGQDAFAAVGGEPVAAAPESPEAPLDAHAVSHEGAPALPAAAVDDGRSAAALATAAPRPPRLFGPLLMVLPGEKVRDFEDIFAGLCDAVKPQDAIEEMFIGDVAEFFWEIARLRRQRTARLAEKATQALGNILYRFYDKLEDRNKLVWSWARGEQMATELVDDLLGKIGCSVDAVLAEALSMMIDEFERIDRLIQSNQLGRERTLREVYRHRATFGHRLRTAVDEAEEAEFTEVEPDPSVGVDAA